MPKRAEETLTFKALNREGEEQANAEQKEGGTNEQASLDGSIWAGAGHV